MSQEKIFINDIEVITDTNIKYNTTILNLSNLSERGVTFTNDLIILYDSNAKKAFNFPDKINSETYAFEKYFPCSIGNIQGKFFLKSINLLTNQIKGQFTELTKEFYDTLDNPLNDLELKQHDFIFTSLNWSKLAHITARDFGSCFIGTYINKFTLTSDLIIDRPQYLVRDIMQEIITQAGYNLNVLEDDKLLLSESIKEDVNSLCMSSNHDIFYVTSYVGKFSNITVSNDFLFSQDTQIYYLVNPYLDPIHSFNTTITFLLQNNKQILNLNVSCRYVIKGKIKVEDNATIIFRIFVVDSPDEIEEFTIQKGTTFINIITGEIKSNPKTTPEGVNTGAIKIEIIGSITFEDVEIFNLVDEKELMVNPDTETGYYQNYIEGLLIRTDYNLPEITQKDLLHRLREFYFIKENINSSEKTITLENIAEKFDVINTNKNIFIDRITKIESGSNFTRRNVFKYENDIDVSLINGSYFLNKITEIETVTTELIVSPSSTSININIDIEEIDRQYIISIPIYILDNELKPERDSYSLRFFKATQFEGVYSHFYKGIWENLSWSYLYSKYYKSVLDYLLQEIVFECEIFLTESQHENLKIVPFFFVEQFKNYIFVTEIVGWVKELKTKVKCVLINTID